MKEKRDTPEWYEFIEKPIQPLVKLLHNNGFKTFSSCGHDMSCYCDYSLGGEIEKLYDLLMDNGYPHFIIQVEILGKYCSRIMVKIPKEEQKHLTGLDAIIELEENLKQDSIEYLKKLKEEEGQRLLLYKKLKKRKK